MSERLVEFGIRGQQLVADLASGLLARARDARGQTTIEWLAVMVGFTALVTILAGDDICKQAGQAIVYAVNAILGQTDDKV